MLRLATTHLEVEIDPSRGAQFSSVRAPGQDNVLALYDWDAPLPSGVGPSYGDPTLDWLSSYRGGWQEMFPNVGAPCIVEGVPLGFHGESSTAGWQLVEERPSSCTLSSAGRLPLELRRRVALAERAPTMVLDEEVVNVGARPIDFAWGHHPAFALPAGSRIDIPPCSLVTESRPVGPHADLASGARARWPEAPGADGGRVDLSVVPAGPVQRICYLADLEAGWAAARRPDGTGFVLSWDLDTFPYLFLWQEIGGPEFPWYGRARITALEPSSTWPAEGLAAAIERGHGLRLKPRASLRTSLRLSLFDRAPGPVRAVDSDGRALFERQERK